MAEEIKISKNTFIGSTSEPITTSYNLEKKIGDGTYGCVYLSTDKRNGLKRAIKQIPRTKIKNIKRLETEIEIMRRTDHPNIVKMYDVVDDGRNVYLVMEVCAGGELFDYIVDQQCFSERKAADVFQQIASSICYLHSMDIVHRDIKPENLMLTNVRDSSSIKLIDFGLSKINEDHKEMKTKAGTPYYIAPEILTGTYSKECDVWSLGVILYILLSGYPPFFGSTDNIIINKVKSRDFDYDSEEWENVTPLCKDLIDKMLVVDPANRLTMEQVLLHEWLTTNRDLIPDTPFNIKQLQDFTRSSQLKKSVLMIIASQCSEKEISSLREKFNRIDANHDGTLTFDEFQSALSEQGTEQQEIQEMWDGIDIDRSGTISYSEFIASAMEENLFLQEEKLRNAFKVFDADGSGSISATELSTVLSNQEEVNPQVWQQIIKEIDENNDGEIDFEEFKVMMTALKNL